MVNFTTGNYRPCIDIEWVLSSLICFTNTCTSVGTVNKIAASSYTFYFQTFSGFEMLLQSSSSLELHIGQAPTTDKIFSE